MLVGADTFRAAGVDQLEHWSKKIGCEFFSKGSGADPGAVAYESVKKAKQNGVDVLIIDTGGRLHTQVGLMSEITKTQKAVSKAFGKDPDSDSISSHRIGQVSPGKNDNFHLMCLLHLL